ncbi:MAG: isoprenyl transferase [Deltaproteobacteria bacterium]|nr:isoprenyl transferase [Deltaproteobacteria bacterium]MCB9488490.1 isoprenyl transferase [Deltaproteobacteria bacterium]
MQDLPPERLPRHIAVIMDGNGRWAKQRRKNRLFGHSNGIDAVRRTVRESHKIGIRCLTLYAFSTENWKRPATEVAGLWRLLKSYVQKELPELRDNGVRLNVIGDVERIPGHVREAIDFTIRETARGEKMLLTICLSYSGRDEIVRACRQIAQEVADGRMTPGQVDEAAITGRLYTARHEIPDPDLMIRTSGEFRISNFLLWQLAYSEIHVTPTLWPDFGPEDLHKAILDYAGRERRFGMTGDQIQSGQTKSRG